MSEIKDGGPAFPTVEIVNISGQDVIVRQTGMTIRDYLAAKAMEGQVGNLCGSIFYTKDSAHIIAEEAYKMADAMLKERERRHDN